MTISEFRQYAKKWSKGQDPVKLLFPLDRLRLLPANKKRKAHAVDYRSFLDSEGHWNIYPIAIDNYHVYIVCPFCQKIHIHGNNKGHYEGPRCPHCFPVQANSYNILDISDTLKRKEEISMTLNKLKTRAKAHDLFIRKDGKGGYLLTDFLNRLMAPGPMTLEEVEMWLDDLDEHQQ